MKVYQLTQFRRDKLALAGRVYGDTLAYAIGADDDGNASRDTTLPWELRLLTPYDAGDDTRPGGQVGSLVFAGLTTTGRWVVLYRVGRSDSRGGFEYGNFAAVGAANPLRAALTRPDGIGGTTMDEATLRRIVAEEVDRALAVPVRVVGGDILRTPPAEDNDGFPPEFLATGAAGTMLQQDILYMLSQPATWALIAPAITRAIRDLQAQGVEV